MTDFIASPRLKAARELQAIARNLIARRDQGEPLVSWQDEMMTWVQRRRAAWLGLCRPGL